MTSSKLVPFTHLPGSDLVVDATYQGGANNDVRDDAIARLLPVGNAGGFRYKTRSDRTSMSNLKLSDIAIMALVIGNHPDWPDEFEAASGLLSYYGDNRTPGTDLHDTKRRGNHFLREAFDAIHADPPRREDVPPFFIFQPTGRGRDVRFVGLAVPGAVNLPEDRDCVALWRSTPQGRFQNYRATFTVLDVGRIHRAWIADLLAGIRLGPSTPLEFRKWIKYGSRIALKAEPIHLIRSREEQLPTTRAGHAILRAVVEHFAPRPSTFEHLAADLWQWMNPLIAGMSVTRAAVDGGRDAIGEMRLGPGDDPVRLTFALEAKCFAERGVGVGDISRLISRIKHREYGVLVTTSFLNKQAYTEIRTDGHPIAVVSGRHVVELLTSRGKAKTIRQLKAWLRTEYPTE